jgi:nucleotide-binding universal stress UspA family protein
LTIADYAVFEEMEKRVFQQHAEILRQKRKQFLTKFPNAKVTMIVGHGNYYLNVGDAGQDIVDYCDKNKADIVIVGSRQLGVMKRVLLGSVGDYCAHHLKCPVLIIRHP